MINVKNLKTTLVLIVLTIIIGCTISWWDEMKPSKPIKKSDCPLVAAVDKQIASIKMLPKNKLTPNEFNKVYAYIISCYNDGSLGEYQEIQDGILIIKKNSDFNRQWKETLISNLYAEYTIKFVEQAMYVFDNSIWDSYDIKVIMAEINRLKNSGYLDVNGVYSSRMDVITKTLALYDEINIFIGVAKSSPTDKNGLNDQYPDLSSIVAKSRNYLANNINNSKVNNCTRLKSELQQIPYVLSSNHAKYLEVKIDRFGGSYKECSSHPDYDAKFYITLSNQLNSFDNKVYGINPIDFQKKYMQLSSKLINYNKDAFNYMY